MGRKRKPTAQHRLEGTYNATDHGDRIDEALSLGTPEKPQCVTDDSEASNLWDLVVSGTHPGMQASIDAPQLESMCFWWSQFRHYSRTMRLPTADIDEERKLMILAKDAWKSFSTIAGQFGMTPSERAKLQLQPEGSGSVDPLLAMLRKRGDN